jgi:hypothetical protein
MSPSFLGFFLRELFVWHFCGLKSGPCICQVGALPLEFFLLQLFSNGVVYLSPGQPGPQSSYLHFSCSWDERHSHHAQLLLVKMRSLSLFAKTASNRKPPNLHLWSSWDYRHEPVFWRKPLKVQVQVSLHLGNTVPGDHCVSDGPVRTQHCPPPRPRWPGHCASGSLKHEPLWPPLSTCTVMSLRPRWGPQLWGQWFRKWGWGGGSGLTVLTTSGCQMKSACDLRLQHCLITETPVNTYSS